MHAIDTAGSIAGKFSEGNPAVGQRATRVGSDWLNDLQANILQLGIETGIAPTKGRAADLLDWIKAIAAGSAGGSGGGVPPTRLVNTSGVITGGGDLSQDRTFSVARASAAEILAGLEDGKVITPAGLFAAIGGSVSGLSIQIGPLIIKAGATVAGYQGDAAVYTAFPTPFPHACWGAFPVARNDVANRNRDIFAQLVGAPSLDGFTTYLQLSAGGNTVNAIDGFNWLALGV